MFSKESSHGHFRNGQCGAQRAKEDSDPVPIVAVTTYFKEHFLAIAGKLLKLVPDAINRIKKHSGF